MDGNGNCWCFNGFLLAKSGWRQSYFKVASGDWGRNFANLVIKPKGACHQTARYTSNGALAGNRCLWRGFCRAPEQVLVGVDGFWPNCTVECGLKVIEPKISKSVCACVQMHIKPTHVCASFISLNAVSAGILFVWLHQVAHHTMQPRR